jgi:hypothetical protein
VVIAFVKSVYTEISIQKEEMYQTNMETYKETTNKLKVLSAYNVILLLVMHILKLSKSY